MKLMDKYDGQSLDATSWQARAFSSFEKILTNVSDAFPCTLGVAGFNANQLRYYYVDTKSLVSTERQIAAALQSYLPVARSFGKNTSLVIFFNETDTRSVDFYENRFWGLLNNIHRLDAKAWPKGIPHLPDNSNWEFSFGGEPIFVVCNTPSHIHRRSRYGEFFSITFQPRWVFSGVIGEDAPNSAKVKKVIRERLTKFDSVPVSSHLGSYGDVENKEWKQYFLADANDDTPSECPFKSVKDINKVQVLNAKTTNLEKTILDMLPPTGSVEVQLDTPKRIHPAHAHATDETLHIVSGDITFEIQGAKITCKSGDRLLLPALTKHESIAGESGCLYVIATNTIQAVDAEVTDAK